MNNPLIQAMNNTFDFTGTTDSLLPTVLVSTAFAAAYLVVVALCRRGFPKEMDLAFALAIATPLTTLIVLGNLGGGLIVGGTALVIGLVLWLSGRRKASENQSGSADRVR
ncbi:hypothetical protein ACIPY2_19685 [Paenarthrobacter sp. NPDC089675]|uniref:hypothetical protein n=1 Tax=Paenarthrobacter TaxID=1742992 RepID=UPI00382720B0